MNKRKWVIITLCIVLGLAVGSRLLNRFLKGPVPVGAPTARPQGEGWLDLLDAAHAPGWQNVTDKKDLFEIKDNALHIYGHLPLPLRYVGYTTEKFANFDLHIEFKLTRHANSGVFLRAQSPESLSRGFELQVLEDYGKPPNKNSCGSIYDVVTPMYNMSLPRGEWNSFDVTVNGKEVIVNMNGWMIIHTDFAKMTKPLGKFKIPYADMPLEGLITLQDHGGEVWYRNILIRKH